MQYGTLRITLGEQARDVPIAAETTAIGSAPTNAVVIDDPSVAPTQLQIVYSAGRPELLVIDEGVPVTVSGVALAVGDTAPLEHGTVIALGAARLVWIAAIAPEAPRRTPGVTPTVGGKGPQAAAAGASADLLAQLLAQPLVAIAPAAPSGSAPNTVAPPTSLVPPAEPSASSSAALAPHQTITDRLESDPAARPLAPPPPPAPSSDGLLFEIFTAAKLVVEPGQVLSFAARITNRTDLTDEPVLLLSGLPDGWETIVFSRPRLFKDDSTDIQISISPPREPASAAGDYQVWLTATFKAQYAIRVERQLTLTVLPYTLYKIEPLIPPEKPGWSEGRFFLPITNQSNHAQRFELRDVSRARAVATRVSPVAPEMGAGETRKVEIIAQIPLRNRAWTGGAKNFEFALGVRPQGTEDPYREVAGTLEHRPLLPPWLVALMLWLPAVIGVFLCVALLLWRFFPESAPGQAVATQFAPLVASAPTETPPPPPSTPSPEPPLALPPVAPPTAAPAPTVDFAAQQKEQQESFDKTATALVGKSDAEKTAAVESQAATLTVLAQTQGAVGTAAAQTATAGISSANQTATAEVLNRIGTQTAFVLQLTQTSMIATETARAFTATPTASGTPAADQIIAFDAVAGTPVTKRTQLRGSEFIDQNVSICFFGLEGDYTQPTETALPPITVNPVVTINPVITVAITVQPVVTATRTPNPDPEPDPPATTLTREVIIKEGDTTPSPPLATLVALPETTAAVPAPTPVPLSVFVDQRRQSEPGEGEPSSSEFKRDSVVRCRPPDILLQIARFDVVGDYIELGGRRLRIYTPVIYPRLTGINSTSNFLTADSGQNEFLPGLFGVVTFQADVVEARISIYNPSPSNVEYVIFGLNEQGQIVAQSPRMLAIPGPFELVASSASPMRQVVIAVPLEAMSLYQGNAQTPLIITRVEFNYRRR